MNAIPENRQAIADALRDRVVLLNQQQQRLQAAIETFVQDCVAAMELDVEKRWVLEMTQQGWALVEQENQLRA